MGKEWAFAKLSEKAAEMGGADKALEILNDLDIIKKEEYAKGARGMAGKMGPWFPVVAVLSVGGTLLVQEIQKRTAKKKEERRISAELATEAEARLIDKLSRGEKAVSSELEPTLGEEKSEGQHNLDSTEQ